jgi:H/ACA ribonucleoprotein complex non-core subunit NAF1
MNDEEPADYELEFSDDEAEAEYKRNIKQKCVFEDNFSLIVP